MLRGAHRSRCWQSLKIVQYGTGSSAPSSMISLLHSLFEHPLEGSKAVIMGEWLDRFGGTYVQTGLPTYVSNNASCKVEIDRWLGNSTETYLAEEELEPNRLLAGLRVSGRLGPTLAPRGAWSTTSPPSPRRR